MPVIPEGVGERDRKCDTTAEGYIKNTPCLNEEKQTLGSDSVSQEQILPSGTRWRLATARSSKQQQLQQLQQQQYINTIHSSRKVHTRTSCSSVQHNTYNWSGPAVLLRNRTRCLRNGKRKNSNNAQSSSSSASSTIRYVYKTDFSIALTTLQSSSMILSCIFLHWNKKQTEKHHVLDSNLRSQGHSDSSLSVRLLTLGSDIIIFQIDMFLYVRMDVSVKMTK